MGNCEHHHTVTIQRGAAQESPRRANARRVCETVEREDDFNPGKPLIQTATEGGGRRDCPSMERAAARVRRWCPDHRIHGNIQPDGEHWTRSSGLDDGGRLRKTHRGFGVWRLSSIDAALRSGSLFAMNFTLIPGFAKILDRSRRDPCKRLLHRPCFSIILQGISRLPGVSHAPP